MNLILDIKVNFQKTIYCYHCHNTYIKKSNSCYIKHHNNVDLKIYLYACVHKKQYLEKFVFLILKILELFAREVCKFFKK